MSRIDVCFKFLIIRAFLVPELDTELLIEDSATEEARSSLRRSIRQETKSVDGKT